jgi:hypothetical protein
MTCGATTHGCGHGEVFVNDAATSGTRGPSGQYCDEDRWSALFKTCLDRPTKHHDLLEYVSSQMIFERALNAEINKQYFEEHLAAGNRTFNAGGNKVLRKSPIGGASSDGECR